MACYHAHAFFLPPRYGHIDKEALYPPTSPPTAGVFPCRVRPPLYNPRMDRALCIDRDGPHYAFALGRVSGVLAQDFHEAIGELSRALLGAQCVTAYLYSGTDVREVHRLPGERQMFLVLADNALGDDTELRRQVVRSLRYLARPMTPDDPEFFTVPDTAGTITP